MDRREFVWLMGCASAAGILPGCMRSQLRGDPYESALFGNARILHFTDCHAQLLPIHFREPNVNIGVGGARGRPRSQFLLELASQTCNLSLLIVYGLII